MTQRIGGGWGILFELPPIAPTTFMTLGSPHPLEGSMYGQLVSANLGRITISGPQKGIQFSLLINADHIPSTSASDLLFTQLFCAWVG